jgi:hypothetical protein
MEAMNLPITPDVVNGIDFKIADLSLRGHSNRELCCRRTILG